MSEPDLVDLLCEYVPALFANRAEAKAYLNRGGKRMKHAEEKANPPNMIRPMRSFALYLVQSFPNKIVELSLPQLYLHYKRWWRMRCMFGRWGYVGDQGVAQHLLLTCRQLSSAFILGMPWGDAISQVMSQEWPISGVRSYNLLKMKCIVSCRMR